MGLRASSATGSRSPAATRSTRRGSGSTARAATSGRSTLSTDGPVTYAVRWSALPGRRPATVATAAEPWLADYRSRGIEAITTGVLVLRKSSGANWAHGEELPFPARGDAGPHLERLFAAQDLLRGLGGERELLTVALELAPGTLLVERRTPAGELDRARVTVEKGFPCRAASRSPRRPSLPLSTGAGRSRTRSPLRLRRHAARRKRSRPSACRCCAS